MGASNRHFGPDRQIVRRPEIWPAYRLFPNWSRLGFLWADIQALATVGARLDYDRWKSFCAGRPSDPNCNPPPEFSFSVAEIQRLLDSDDRVKESIGHSHDSFLDDRIRAAFAIAPVLGPVMTKASLAEVKVPVRIIVGSKDDQAVPEIKCRVDSHVQFRTLNSSFSRMLRTTPSSPGATYSVESPTGSLCTDPDEIDRDEVHRAVGADARKFFNRTLQENLGDDELGK